MGANKTLLEQAVDLYNARDLDSYMDLYAEDAVLTAPDGNFQGRNKIQERLARELTGFPDASFEVRSVVEQGDKFADEFIFRGTHSAPYRLPNGTELPPSGKRVEIKGMEFVQVRDGKMVVDNLYWDSVTYLAQLGVIPEAIAAGA